MDATRLKPARQPEAVAAGFESKRNPRDRTAGPDRFILPAMQQAKQPLWARLQVLARLTLNPGKHAGNEPARLAHLDDGYDRATLVKGDERPARSHAPKHAGRGRSAGASLALHRLDAATQWPFLAGRPKRLSVPDSDDGFRSNSTA